MSKHFVAVGFCVGIFFTQNLWAGVCDQAWSKEAHARQTQVLCQLEWKSGEKGGEVMRGIEWVKIKQGCSMEGGPKTTCLVARECDPQAKTAGALGEGVLLLTPKRKSFCSGLSVMPLLGRNRQEGSASLLCSNDRPTEILLQGPTQEKRCAVGDSLSW